ncbi:MAG TPA: substrate-binding domain-containing protein [Sphingomicrobium sp.]|nr:substrate-binding domain-containing protein [Sphingomicrobium sp.]
MAAVKAIFMAAVILASEASDHHPPPRRMNPDELVIATSRQLAPLLQRTASRLEQERSALKVSVVAVGSDIAMAELYTRQADLAVIGRPATDPEIKAFQWIYQYPPKSWPVLRGSVAAAGHSPAIRLLVNTANPIRKISLQQLELAYRGSQKVHWRDLGVTGPLSKLAVHPIMPDSEQGTGRFIRDAFFKGATLFAWDRVKEVSEPLHRGAVDTFGLRIARAVAHDPQAIAFSSGNPVAGTRVVPFTCTDIPSALVCDNKGALERLIYAYSDADLRPGAREFLLMLAGSKGRSAIKIAPYRKLPDNEGRELSGSR